MATSTAIAPDRRRARFRARAAGVALAICAFAAGAYVWRVGLPTDGPQVLLWLLGPLVVIAWARPELRVWRVVADWLPFGLLLFAWNWSRGLAVRLHRPVHVLDPVRVDRWLGLGHVPTVWLQHHLGVNRQVHAWEVLPSFVYVTHFVASYVVAAWLWVRDRARWLAFVERFVTLTVAGVVTYVAVPWAPPWLAGQQHALPTVWRTSAHGWTYLHLGFAASALSAGQASVNLNAALPSLHAAFTVLIACTLWPTAPRWGRLVLALYPLAMGITLVLTGEHYVIDILVGWAYALVVHLAWNRIERRRTPARRDPPVLGVLGGAPAPPSTPKARG